MRKISNKKHKHENHAQSSTGLDLGADGFMPKTKTHAHVYDYLKRNI